MPLGELNASNDNDSETDVDTNSPIGRRTKPNAEVEPGRSASSSNETVKAAREAYIVSAASLAKRFPLLGKTRKALDAVAGLGVDKKAPVGAVPAEVSRSLIDATANQTSFAFTGAALQAFKNPYREELEKLEVAIGLVEAELQKEKVANREELQAFVDQAKSSAAFLTGAIERAARDFPHSLAGGNTPSNVRFSQGDAGANAAVQKMNYDFDRRTSDPQGRENAIFKEEPQRLEQDPGLSTYGVETGKDGLGQPTDERPMRLSLRARATTVVADLLGLRGLVVRTEIASVQDQRGAKRFGIIMERADGKPAATRIWVSTPPTDPAVPVFKALEVAYQDANRTLQNVSVARVDVESAGYSAWNTKFEAANAAVKSAQAAVARASKSIRRTNNSNDSWQVRGVEARSVDDNTMKSAKFRRALVNAELIDHICGQIDRHMGNIFIAGTGDEAVVKLIDNDLAFAPKDTYVKGEKNPAVAKRISRPLLPKVVDKEMKVRILNVTNDQIRTNLTGLLTEAEVEATINRLEFVKAYLRGNLDEAPAVASMDGSAKLRWDDPDPKNLFHFSDGFSPLSYYNAIAIHEFSPDFEY